MKTLDFDIYGQKRDDTKKKSVPCLLRTNPESKINQKFYKIILVNYPYKIKIDTF